MQKNPLIGGFLNLLLPGLGHIYVGKLKDAVLEFIGAMIAAIVLSVLDAMAETTDIPWSDEICWPLGLSIYGIALFVNGVQITRKYNEQLDKQDNEQRGPQILGDSRGLAWIDSIPRWIVGGFVGGFLHLILVALLTASYRLLQGSYGRWNHLFVLLIMAACGSLLYPGYFLFPGPEGVSWYIVSSLPAVLVGSLLFSRNQRAQAVGLGALGMLIRKSVLNFNNCISRYALVLDRC